MVRKPSLKLINCILYTTRKMAFTTNIDNDYCFTNSNSLIKHYNICKIAVNKHSG